MKLKVEYQEWDLTSVMEYFIEGFDQKSTGYEYFIDTDKKKVVFKLFVEEGVLCSTSKKGKKK